MTIEKHLDLTSLQIEAIQGLVETCNEKDQHEIPAPTFETYGVSQDFPRHYLAFEEEELIGYLQLFLPSLEEAEAIAWVRPDKREQGIFRYLVEDASKDLVAGGWKELLFVTNGRSKVGGRVLRAIGAGYSHSERVMVAELGLSIEPPTGTLHLCTKANRNLYLRLDGEIFDTSGVEAAAFFESLVSDEKRRFYLYEVDQVYVGMAGFHKTGDRGMIFGLGIHPDRRGEGLGRDLLRGILWEIGREKKPALEVDEENTVAINLYESAGFVTEKMLDYYRKDL